MADASPETPNGPFPPHGDAQDGLTPADLGASVHREAGETQEGSQ